MTQQCKITANIKVNTLFRRTVLWLHLLVLVC